MMRRAPFLLLCLLVSLSAATASAQTTVVILLSDDTDAQQRFERRMAAELRSMGFSPITISLSTQSFVPEQLDRIAREHGAVAAVALRSDAGIPSIWIADRSTAKLLRRELPVQGDDLSGLHAVRAVELLRASLIELESATPPREQVVVSPALREIARSSLQSHRSAARVRVALSGGGAVSFGGMAPSGVGLLELAVIPSRWLGICGLFTFPLTPSRFSGGGGDVVLWSGLAALALKIAFLTPDILWTLDLDAGIGGQLTLADGMPDEGYSGRSETERSIVPLFRIGASRHLYRALSMRIDILTAFALPPIRIRTPEKTATFGLPWTAITLGFDLTF